MEKISNYIFFSWDTQFTITRAEKLKSHLLHAQSVVSHVCFRVLELRGWRLHEGDKHKMCVPWKICAQRHYWFFHLHVQSWIRTKRKRYREASHGHTDWRSKIFFYFIFFPQNLMLYFSRPECLECEDGYFSTTTNMPCRKWREYAWFPKSTLTSTVLLPVIATSHFFF